MDYSDSDSDSDDAEGGKGGSGPATKPPAAPEPAGESGPAATADPAKPAGNSVGGGNLQLAVRKDLMPASVSSPATAPAPAPVQPVPDAAAASVKPAVNGTVLHHNLYKGERFVHLSTRSELLFSSLHEGPSCEMLVQAYFLTSTLNTCMLFRSQRCGERWRGRAGHGIPAPSRGRQGGRAQARHAHRLH